MNLIGKNGRKSVVLFFVTGKFSEFSCHKKTLREDAYAAAGKFTKLENTSLSTLFH